MNPKKMYKVAFSCSSPLSPFCTVEKAEGLRSGDQEARIRRKSDMDDMGLKFQDARGLSADKSPVWVSYYFAILPFLSSDP